MNTTSIALVVEKGEDRRTLAVPVGAREQWDRIEQSLYARLARSPRFMNLVERKPA